jgi:hypothetical protein
MSCDGGHLGFPIAKKKHRKTLFRELFKEHSYQVKIPSHVRFRRRFFKSKLIRIAAILNFCMIDLIDLLCLMPLSAIFQLYHGNQFQWWKKPEYLERTTNHGQATGKLYHLRLQVKCTLFCNLQSRVRTHAILVIGLYELLGNPTT